MFSNWDPKFLSQYHDILPKSKELFVHEEVMSNIFNDLISHQAAVFKHFDVTGLALHLSGTLSPGYFEEWCPDHTELPNGHWISRVWSFLATIWKSFVNNARRKNESTSTRIRSMLKPSPTGAFFLQLKPSFYQDLMTQMLARKLQKTS